MERPLPLNSFMARLVLQLSSLAGNKNGVPNQLPSHSQLSSVADAPLFNDFTYLQNIMLICWAFNFLNEWKLKIASRFWVSRD
ncbi:uncharacterized protein LOC120294163 isoform X2 [Eucalyptus grandis]|uniref:uncharacterized protein LOC120294163 isoform X2 n=1 Tax=Eucalyptus grandis TaxID=71139 RepID=UPI00192EB9AE|nr:uncharacterized protein LOC120294163 isoform X2 [Eucalyptus grandis]